MTSARARRNTSAQPGDRYGVKSRCLGNDHDISVAGSWRDVTLPLRNKKKKTYPLQTCYEHNMLSSLHAVCLKVLVFFFLFKPHVSPIPPSLVRAFLLCDIKSTCSPSTLTLIPVTDQTEVSCQTHDPVPSPPEKEATVPTDQETGWKPESVGVVGKSTISFLTGNRTAIPQVSGPQSTNCTDYTL